MTARLFTQAELDTMCRPPKEQMMAALEAGDRQAAKNKYAELEAAFLAFHDIYYHWVATIQEFLYERYGHDGLAKAAPLGAVLIEALKLGLSVGEVLNCSQSATERMAALIDAGDVEGAKRLYAYMEKGFRDLHDLYREWTSMLLSHVYRTYGIGALEDCLRFSSERRWMPWMMEDITRDAKDRLQSWCPYSSGISRRFAWRRTTRSSPSSRTPVAAAAARSSTVATNRRSAWRRSPNGTRSPSTEGM